MQLFIPQNCLKVCKPNYEIYITLICDQKEHAVWSNVLANKVFCSMCLRENLTVHADCGGLVVPSKHNGKGW